MPDIPQINYLQQDIRYQQIDVFPVTQGRPIPSDIPDEDSDKLFLLSLLEPLKSIPESMRFGTKIKLMRVIQNSQARATLSGYSNSNNDDSYQQYDNSNQNEYSEDSMDRMSFLDQRHLEPEMEIVEML